jgi:hypothetical protein
LQRGRRTLCLLVSRNHVCRLAQCRPIPPMAILFSIPATLDPSREALEAGYRAITLTLLDAVAYRHWSTVPAFLRVGEIRYQIFGNLHQFLVDNPTSSFWNYNWTVSSPIS